MQGPYFSPKGFFFPARRLPMIDHHVCTYFAYICSLFAYGIFYLFTLCFPLSCHVFSFIFNIVLLFHFSLFQIFPLLIG
jgi:hypothetical protein